MSHLNRGSAVPLTVKAEVRGISCRRFHCRVRSRCESVNGEADPVVYGDIHAAATVRYSNRHRPAQTGSCWVRVRAFKTSADPIQTQKLLRSRQRRALRPTIACCLLPVCLTVLSSCRDIEVNPMFPASITLFLSYIISTSTTKVPLGGKPPQRLRDSTQLFTL